MPETVVCAACGQPKELRRFPGWLDVRGAYHRRGDVCTSCQVAAKQARPPGPAQPVGWPHPLAPTPADPNETPFGWRCCDCGSDTHARSLIDPNRCMRCQAAREQRQHQAA